MGRHAAPRSGARRQTEALLKLIAKLNVGTVLDVGYGSGDNLAALKHAMPQLDLSGVGGFL